MKKKMLLYSEEEIEEDKQYKWREQKCLRHNKHNSRHD